MIKKLALCNVIKDVQIFAGFDFDEEQTRQIESRHNDLLELEKSIVELAEMFTEMSVMIGKDTNTKLVLVDSQLTDKASSGIFFELTRAKR